MTAPTEHHADTFTRIRKDAIAAAKSGLAVLPLYAFDEGELAQARGKRPRAMDWQKKKLSVEEITEWWGRHPRSNMGIICGEKSGLVCLDIDPRAGGLAWAEANAGLLAGCSSAKEISGRGDGGFHLWFSHPGTPVRSGKLADGVDLKADGGHQVVVAPSIHASTGDCYQWQGAITDASDLTILAPPIPEWLRTMANQLAPAKERRPIREGEITDDPLDAEIYRQWLSDREQPVRFTGANIFLYLTAQKGRDLALAWTTTLACMAEWNKNPEIPESELRPIVRNAYKYGKEEPGNASVRVFSTTPAEMPEAQAQAHTPVQEEALAEMRADVIGMSWHDDLAWVYTKEKDPKDRERICVKPTLNSAVVTLAHHSATRGVFTYDEFSHKVLIRRALPWSSDRGPRELTDHDVAECRIWLEKLDIIGAVYSKEVAFDAMLSVAHRCKVHPVRSYLAGLHWDGVKRLDGWMSTTYGLEDSAIHRAYSRRTLIAAVARVMQPGCQVDTVMILEGEQGYYKTQGLKVLAAPWVKELHGDVQSKDFLLALRGAWIVEIGELSSFNRAEANHLKALISCRSDTIRDPYARTSGEVPRQCVWVGTTNADHYLTDTTGNRRFWPVRVVNKGKLDWLRANRDQLWAEARVAYSADEQWWLTDEEEELSQAQVGERQMENPLLETVRQAVDGDGDMVPRLEVSSINNILVRCGFLPTKSSVGEAKRVGECLRELGWERTRMTVGGRVAKMWRRK